MSFSTPVYNPGAQANYNDLLNRNQSNYNNILSGYQSAQGNLSGQLSGIYGGYGTDLKQIENTLGVTGGGWGVAAPAAQAIDRSFTQAQGQTDQSLASAGLGNTTVRGSMQNQNALQAGQAYGSLGAQLAQTAAGYQSQFGLAGLAARMQGAGMQTGLTQSYLGNLAGYHFTNPFGNLYGQQSGGGGGEGGGSGVGGQSLGNAMNQSDQWANRGVGNAFNPGNSYGYSGGGSAYNPYAGNQGPAGLGSGYGTNLNYDSGYGSVFNNPGLGGDIGNQDFGGGGDF